MFMPIILICSSLNPAQCANLPEEAPVSQFRSYAECSYAVGLQAPRIVAAIKDKPLTVTAFCIEIPQQS